MSDFRDDQTLDLLLHESLSQRYKIGTVSDFQLEWASCRSVYLPYLSVLDVISLTAIYPRSCLVCFHLTGDLLEAVKVLTSCENSWRFI